MSIIRNPFTRVTAALTLTTAVSGCLGNMDPYAATAAGAALGYGLGQEVNDSWGGYAGGAIGGALANAAINTAQACTYTDDLNRQGYRDNISGQRIEDNTYQSEGRSCVTHGRAPTSSGSGLTPVW